MRPRIRADAAGCAMRAAACVRRCEEHRSARIYVARAQCADGILEAMRHFGFLLEAAAENGV